MARVWLRALSGPALVAAVLGAALSVMCTGIITPRLWLGTAMCWIFVPALQALTALVFLRTRRLPLPAFLDVLFRTHRPWTLWYIAVAGLLLLWPQVPPFWFEVTALVPLVLTFRLLVALCVDVLGVDRQAAIRRVAAHQVATVLLIVCAQLPSLLPRALGLLQR
jgi:hypothetical protein